MFATATHPWPDGIDWTITAGYFALMFGVAAAAYISMSLHIRDYLRSLRRALVLISHYRLELPDWIRRDKPRCIQALGLTLPCTTGDILSAYRREVKLLHPDRGGDYRDFLRLQEHFEQAMVPWQESNEISIAASPESCDSVLMANLPTFGETDSQSDHDAPSSPALPGMLGKVAI